MKLKKKKKLQKTNLFLFISLYFLKLFERYHRKHNSALVRMKLNGTELELIRNYNEFIHRYNGIKKGDKH